jgi:hypothetical protein
LAILASIGYKCDVGENIHKEVHHVKLLRRQTIFKVSFVHVLSFQPLFVGVEVALVACGGPFGGAERHFIVTGCTIRVSGREALLAWVAFTVGVLYSTLLKPVN